jgi:hypothetical protein
MSEKSGKVSVNINVYDPSTEKPKTVSIVLVEEKELTNNLKYVREILHSKGLDSNM